MKSLLLTIVSLLFAGFVFAQPGIKLGHINSQDLLQAMPESDSAQAKLEKIAKEFQSQIEAMQVEFNNKYQDYTSKMNTYSELIRQTKETELQEMNQRIQQFQQSAQDDMSKKRAEIYKPVLDKANKAIAEVAKENSFTYIFDISAGTVIYHSDNSTDILSLVKQKLKLK